MISHWSMKMKWRTQTLDCDSKHFYICSHCGSLQLNANTHGYSFITVRGVCVWEREWSAVSVSLPLVCVCVCVCYLLVSYGAYLSGNTCMQRWKNRTCRSRRKSTWSKSAIIIITTTAASGKHSCRRDTSASGAQTRAKIRVSAAAAHGNSARLQTSIILKKNFPKLQTFEFIRCGKKCRGSFTSPVSMLEQPWVEKTHTHTHHHHHHHQLRITRETEHTHRISSVCTHITSLQYCQ